MQQVSHEHGATTRTLQGRKSKKVTVVIHNNLVLRW